MIYVYVLSKTFIYIRALLLTRYLCTGGGETFFSAFENLIPIGRSPKSEPLFLTAAAAPSSLLNSTNANL